MRMCMGMCMCTYADAWTSDIDASNPETLSSIPYSLNS